MNDYLFAKVDKMVRVQIYLKNLSKNLFQAEPTRKPILQKKIGFFFYMRVKELTQKDCA